MPQPRSSEDWQALSYEAAQLFSPSAPVDEGDLFAGRSDQINKTIEVILERGKHVILFGERGVGKTSFAHVLRLLIPSLSSQVFLIREQADPSDDFTSIWKKVFKDIKIKTDDDEFILYDQYKNVDKLAPDDVRRILDGLFKASQIPIIVIDEFDKIKDSETKSLIANTLKYLSDFSINVTLMIVGVADDIGELVDQHESIARCIEQIPMPRMSNDEMKEILHKRLPRLNMKIEPDALWKVITLSRGLPSYVHLLGLFAVQDAIQKRRMTVTEENVDAAINRAIEKSQESVQRDYATAIHTNRSDTLFQEVLIACALAKTDDRGMFSPNSIVGPLSSILDKEVTIANFQNHLKKFIGEERSRILIRKGKERAYKFRFRDPMMQPYVIMKGVEAGLIEAKALDVLASPAQPELPI